MLSTSRVRFAIGIPIRECTVLLIVAASVAAQSPTWINMTSAGPSARVSPGMAYDSARGVTVLFGGSDNVGNFSGETWEFNGLSWVLRATTGPSPRQSFGMAYDSARQVTVLYGGNDATTVFDETWEWDGLVWTLRNNVSNPSARYDHFMSYDSTRGVMVMYGGFPASGGMSPDTFEYDGNAWTYRAGMTPAGRRYNHRMAYDPIRQKTVVFGGFTPGGASFETFEWNGSTWTQVSSSGPSARAACPMVFDSARGSIILFGGGGPGIPTPIFGDTWEWDGNSWTQLAVSGPPARGDHGMAYDSNYCRIVLFGGYTTSTGISPVAVDHDTWILVDPISCPASPLGPCAAGNVMATLGGTIDLLFVNGSSGAPTRQVNIPLATSFAISVNQSPSNPFPSLFAIYGFIGVPDSIDLTTLPYGIGTMCFPSYHLNPGQPGLFVLTNNYGPDAFALVTSTPAPWNIIVNGLPFPFQFALQGIINENPATVRVTNGVLVNVQ